MIVLDASAAVAALLSDGPARAAAVAESLHAPHLIDSEVVHTLRRRALSGALPAPAAETALRAWSRVGLIRYPTHSLIERIWELRHNVSAYDAGYVALAEALGVRLVTGDRRLAAATGPRCAVTVVPG